ncbi:MAG: hypothetical protein HC911_16010 [Chloroflexaceae bacterium]|nr:hypothetical protein [Chloroflexaceae bacterium]
MAETNSNIGDVLAPVDYVVVEFPDGQPTAGGFDRLLDLADRRVIQVLDVEFLRRDTAGVQLIPATELPSVPGLDLGLWQGASSGLLNGEDLALIGEQMTVGAVAVVVVFENLWVLDVVTSWTTAGGRILLDGGIPVADLMVALEEAESR